MPETEPPPNNEVEEWKYALIGGGVSLPFTTFSYWQTGSELSLGAVLFGGIIAGYLVNRAGSQSGGVGIRVGVIGGLPVLWVLFDILTAFAGVTGPSWFVTSTALFSIGFGIVVVVLGLGIAALIGEIGARFGSWLASKKTRKSSTVDGY